jgi:hypothetical protein
MPEDNKVKEAIKEANELADRLIAEAQGLQGWHKRQANLSYGQVVFLSISFLIVGLIF